jgi:hypothetical protein
VDFNSRSLCNHGSKKFQGFHVTGIFTLKHNHNLQVRSQLSCIHFYIQSQPSSPYNMFFWGFRHSNLKLQVHMQPTLNPAPNLAQLQLSTLETTWRRRRRVLTWLTMHPDCVGQQHQKILQPYGMSQLTPTSARN